MFQSFQVILFLLDFISSPKNPSQFPKTSEIPAQIHEILTDPTFLFKQIIFFKTMHVIQMKQTYPFGQLSGVITEKNSAMVKKTLHYSNETEYDMIQHMVHFIKIAKHEHLVNIIQVKEGGDCVELYYEYAPLKLERWIIDVNEEIAVSMENQLIELAEYLTRASIKFQFDPLSVGLSEDLSAKYFLNQFSVDMENQELNLAQVKAQIKEYFRQLQIIWKYEGSIDQEKEENSPKAMSFQSSSTVGSISNIDEFVVPSPKCLSIQAIPVSEQSIPQKPSIKSHLSQDLNLKKEEFISSKPFQETSLKMNLK